MRSSLESWLKERTRDSLESRLRVVWLCSSDASFLLIRALFLIGPDP